MLIYLAWNSSVRTLTIFVLKLGKIHILLHLLPTFMLKICFRCASTSQYNHGFLTSSSGITDPFNVNFNTSVAQHNYLDVELHNFNLVVPEIKIFSNVCIYYVMFLRGEKGSWLKVSSVLEEESTHLLFQKWVKSAPYFLLLFLEQKCTIVQKNIIKFLKSLVDRVFQWCLILLKDRSWKGRMGVWSSWNERA